MNDRVKQHYASVKNPTIEAITNSLFRFSTKEQAAERLDSIRTNFTISKQQIDKNKEDSLVLWIRGYKITPEEKKQGFFGNYAVVAYKETDDKKITLYATKLETELKYHPQRRRPKQRHPNWGHPILRSVKKQKTYPTIEEARSELQQLHEEFPDVTIPCTNKTYVMIYSRTVKPPVQKYVLEIKVVETGGYYIHFESNTYTPPLTVQKKESEEKDAVKAEVPQGYFTSMVELKRKPPTTSNQ